MEWTGLAWGPGLGQEVDWSGLEVDWAQAQAQAWARRWTGPAGRRSTPNAARRALPGLRLRLRRRPPPPTPRKTRPGRGDGPLYLAHRLRGPLGPQPRTLRLPHPRQTHRRCAHGGPPGRAPRRRGRCSCVYRAQLCADALSRECARAHRRGRRMLGGAGAGIAWVVVVKGVLILVFRRESGEKERARPDASP